MRPLASSDAPSESGALLRAVPGCAPPVNASVNVGFLEVRMFALVRGLPIQTGSVDHYTALFYTLWLQSLVRFFRLVSVPATTLNAARFGLQGAPKPCEIPVRPV